MSHCARCERNVYPTQELQANGTLKDVCPECSTPVSAETAQPARAVAQPKRITPQEQAEPPDVVALMRARYEYVASRILELRSFEAEERMLRRMLDAAAEPQPIHEKTN